MAESGPSQNPEEIAAQQREAEALRDQADAAEEDIDDNASWIEYQNKLKQEADEAAQSTREQDALRDNIEAAEMLTEEEGLDVEPIYIPPTTPPPFNPPQQQVTTNIPPNPNYAPPAPSYAPSAPTYAPPTPGYAPGTPGYPPASPDYAPQAPEVNDFERRAVEILNGVVQRDNDRARERYRGLLGKVREWFDREGRRTEAQTLDQVAEWQKNPKWKKWARIGAKIAGGAGIAAAMVFTGGAGAILTPLLWGAGMKEAWDGALEAVEELGWGRKRSRAELEMQSGQSEAISRLKERVRAGDLDEVEFQRLVNEVLDAENQVMGRQETNMRGERKGRLIRGIASTVLTIGTGLFAGVPLGTHDFDGATKVGNVFLDQSHRVMWNMDGAKFLYNSPEELTRVAGEVAKHGYGWTIEGAGQHLGMDLYRQAGHMLGQGLPALQKAALSLPLIYMAGRWVEQYIPRKGVKGNYTPHEIYGPSQDVYVTGSPGPYLPGSAGTGAESRPGVNIPGREPRTRDAEKAKVSTYFEKQSQEHKDQLEQEKRNLPPMSEKCRMAICIPAAFSEHRVIYQTLEKYLNQKDLNGQPIPSESFELNILVNGPMDKAIEVNQTIGEILRFQDDHPELKVNIVKKMLPEKATIGYIRKFINDLTVLRGQERANADGPLYLASNDADVESIGEQYIAKAIDAFDKNPNIEMIAGKADFKEEDYQQYPYLRAARRLWQFADVVMRDRRYSDFLPKTLGNNSFIRAESYAKAGGYNRESWVAEDLVMARDVAKVSGSKAIEYNPAIAIRTNARRDIDFIEQGKPVVKSYDTFGARERLRENNARPVKAEQLTPDNPEFINRLNKEATATFETVWGQFFWPAFDAHPEVIERRRQQGPEADVKDLTKKLVADQQVGGEAYRKAGRVFRKAMGFWGAKYDLYEDQNHRVKVKITDWTKLREGLAGR